MAFFYLRPATMLGNARLLGLDYDELHIRRITFARDGLFGPRHTLPTWYPHEVLGSPFAANVQSFPWIPTRLLILLLDPSRAYAAGVTMAAALSAIFTFLYCRRANLSRTGAFAAAGTFACAGYFASRVMAGHLPLLEAYPALPLLLWLVDRGLAPERARRHRFDLTALAFCSACVVAAGHPQLPAYSLAAALLYSIWKARTWRNARVAASILLGAGLVLAMWWPMLLLIGRSTRVEHLAATDNDVVMPYSRLLALFVPGIQGWPPPVELTAKSPFAGYPNAAYFWDTAPYIGLLPLAAIVALFVECILRKRMPDARSRFLACLGVAAFLASLPLGSPLLHLLPGTFFRSPARLLYLSTFCVSFALGISVDSVRKLVWLRDPAIATALIALALSLHFLDLWGFAHRFIQVTLLADQDAPQFEAILDREVGSGRIAEERDNMVFSYMDRYDDASGFDSIFLARFYRGLLALEGAPPDLNRQSINAAELPVKALEATGVRFVITTQERNDLQLVESTDEANLYRVANSTPRADFFTAARTTFVEEQQIPKMFAADPKGKLLLPLNAVRVDTPENPVREQPRVDYHRPSSDEIVLRSNYSNDGFVHVLEAYDPGWIATLDGTQATVIPANGFTMAIPVPAGNHVVRLQYQTPGRTTGITLSICSLGLLLLLIQSVKLPKY